MVNLSKQITGVVVTYNSKDLIEKAYDSIRQFCPDMKIIIVDGSVNTNPCYSYLKELKGNNYIIQVGYNIGHGRGMCLGAYYVETPYILFFDSDIVMKKNPLQLMMKMFEEDTFGIGCVMKVGFDGFNTHITKGHLPYLHPFFQLVKVVNYQKFYPYAHHGAPCLFTMIDIYKKKLSEKILKNFNLTEYIQHDWAGTRNICAKNRQPEIEGVWEINKGQV